MKLERKVCGKFVSQKVSVIRWVPNRAEWGGTGFTTDTGTNFVTGSWDDQPNQICLWSASDTEPKKLSALDHVGDVNAIKFCHPETFVCGSSAGFVRVYRVNSSSAQDQASLEERYQWKSLHGKGFSGMSCNALDALSEHVVSVGEDGKIAVLNIKHQDPVRVYQEADSCSLTAVTFIKQDEVLTANMRGQLKLWDLRSSSDSPETTSVLPSDDQIGVGCLSTHPSQTHIVCSGSSDGSISFWDLRQGRYAFTVLKGHDKAVTEVRFHQQQPDHMFSCSQAGDVLHWNGGAASRLSFANQVGKFNDSTSAALPDHKNLWFSNEAVKHRVETTALIPKQFLPINSLDSLGTSLAIAGDNESVFLVENVLL